MEGKKANVIIKIDPEKTFDKLEWAFIYKTLQYFNIFTILSNIIMNCITIRETAILVSGDRTKFFEPSKGIRQGDRLSPYIFLLCMEMLSQNIEREVRYDNWNL